MSGCLPTTNIEAPWSDPRCLSGRGRGPRTQPAQVGGMVFCRSFSEPSIQEPASHALDLTQVEAEWILLTCACWCWVPARQPWKVYCMRNSIESRLGQGVFMRPIFKVASQMHAPRRLVYFL
jgi:hypothetical protein